MKHAHRPKLTGPVDELTEYRTVAKNKLLLTIFITGAMMSVEIIGGLMTHSLALLSDAGHMFTHFFALAVSFAAIHFAERQHSEERTFGFFRVEILSALFNSLFLFAVTGLIFWEGVKRIMAPSPVLSGQMFFIAGAGLIVNLVSAWILHGANKDDLNVRGAFLHMLADTLSSVVIVLGAVIIYFSGWDIIDPVLSIGIAGVICVWGWGLLRDAVHILLESVPKGMATAEVVRVLMREIPEIEEITDLHIWVITSQMYSMTAHIKLKDNMARDEERVLLNRIKQLLDEHFDVGHTTIEFS